MQLQALQRAARGALRMSLPFKRFEFQTARAAPRAPPALNGSFASCSNTYRALQRYWWPLQRAGPPIILCSESARPCRREGPPGPLRRTLRRFFTPSRGQRSPRAPSAGERPLQVRARHNTGPIRTSHTKPPALICFAGLLQTAATPQMGRRGPAPRCHSKFDRGVHSTLVSHGAAQPPPWANPAAKWGTPLKFVRIFFPTAAETAPLPCEPRAHPDCTALSHAPSINSGPAPPSSHASSSSSSVRSRSSSMNCCTSRSTKRRARGPLPQPAPPPRQTRPRPRA